MSVKDIVAELVLLPRNLNSRRDVSAYSLVRETGYFKSHQEVTSNAIHQTVVMTPELVTEWLSYSEDKRTNEGWFFQRGPEGFQVGRLASDSSLHSLVNYTDEFIACAAFIKHEAESIRGKAT